MLIVVYRNINDKHQFYKSFSVIQNTNTYVFEYNLYSLIQIVILFNNIKYEYICIWIQVVFIDSIYSVIQNIFFINIIFIDTYMY